MASDVAVHREVRLSAPASFALPSARQLARGLARGAEVEIGATSTLVSAYHDTVDLRLTRRGVTFLHRRGRHGGWTLELPRPTKSGPRLDDCRIVEAPGHDHPPASLVRLVTAYVRREPVVEVARLEIERTPVVVCGQDGARVQCDVDAVTAHTDRRPPVRLGVIELRLSGRTAGGLADTLVERLRAAGAGAGDPHPPFVRALGPRALAGAELALPTLPEQPTVGEVLQLAVVRAVNLVLDHDHVIRLDDHIEGVHQARVGTRRLRSNLRTYAGAFDEARTRPLVRELGWLARRLGRVRDPDVLLTRLHRHVDALAEEDRDDGRRLIDRLAVERARAHDGLVEVYESDRYVELLERLVDLARNPSFTAEADQPALEAFTALVHPTFAHVRDTMALLGDTGSATDTGSAAAAAGAEAEADVGGGEAVGREPTDTELHLLRIDVKRARYAAEVAVPVWGRDVTAFTKALGDLQDLLGDHHDAQVAEEWLRSGVERRPAGVGHRRARAQALVAGELVAAQQAERRAHRVALPGVWAEALVRYPWHDEEDVEHG